MLRVTVLGMIPVLAVGGCLTLAVFHVPRSCVGGGESSIRYIDLVVVGNSRRMRFQIVGLSESSRVQSAVAAARTVKSCCPYVCYDEGGRSDGLVVSVRR